MAENRPLRAVTAAALSSGRGSLVGPDTRRRTIWWDLTLECGHHAERPVNQGSRRQVMDLNRLGLLKRPARARCDLCPRETR